MLSCKPIDIDRHASGVASSDSDSDSDSGLSFDRFRVRSGSVQWCSFECEVRGPKSYTMYNVRVSGKQKEK